MEVRKLLREDWSWIENWFRDEELDRELGPLDREWLDAVLEQDDGIQLVAVEDGEAIALVGCAWNSSAHEPHGMTDIAIAPHRRRSGFGRRVMAEILGWNGHPRSGGWVAFVSPRNLSAYKFLSSLEWRYCGIDGEMHRFELPSNSL